MNHDPTVGTPPLIARALMAKPPLARPRPAESLSDGGFAPWPAAVGEAWAARLAAPPGPPAPGAEAALLPGWWLRGDALGGTALFARDPVSGRLRRFAEADRHGHLHSLCAWFVEGANAFGSADPQGNPAWARLRLPGGGWLDWEPGSTRHPLWGAADRLLAEGETRARVAAQPWGALEHIPALDRPAALPPGAGEAALNWLAALAADQGRAALRYCGPYPTAHLFDALRRSFRLVERGTGLEGEARTRFSGDELTLALSGRAVENPVPWSPAPWTALAPAPGVLIRHRDGIETVWIGAVPFRGEPPAGGAASGELSGRAKSGPAPLAAGERLWREGPPGAARTLAGLVLLGEPHRVFLVLQGDGRVLEERLPAAGGEAGTAHAGRGPPLAVPWLEPILAWCALRAAPPLAAAVWALRGRLRLGWAPLPLTFAAREGDRLWVQAGLIEQFHWLRALRTRGDPGALALMLFSDVASGLLPHVLRLAQADLEAAPPPGDLAALLRAGAEAQARAKAVLAEAVPPLLRALAEGKLLEEA